MNIVVLAGGLSPERDVSLSSGSLIANALMERGHAALLLDVYEGAQQPARFRTAGESAPYRYAVPKEEPDLEAVRARCGGRRAQVGPGVIELCAEADVVFLALHGAMGENGQLQALLACYAIPYTGTAYDGCLLAMDKDLTKKLLRHADIPTADWGMYRAAPDTPARIAREIGLPCVVKPRGCGSSVGISIVESECELESALAYALKYEPEILVEKKIEGREFSVGMLQGQALPPIEILPLHGFYDYTNKYQPGLSREICPANLSAEETARAQALARATHRALRLGSYSRIDFIQDAAGAFICLEANTLPGMTPTSLLPQEAAAAGISYAELCARIACSPVR